MYAVRKDKMSSKIIEYDLRMSGRNYDALFEVIKGYDAWARVTESTWIVKSSFTCSQIRNSLLSIVDSNDRIFVAELTGTAAWANVICGSEKLKQNL